MTSPEDILRGLYDETLVGNAPRVLERARFLCGGVRNVRVFSRQLPLVL